MDAACLSLLGRYGDKGNIAILSQVRSGPAKVRRLLEEKGAAAVPSLLAGLDLDDPAAVKASAELLAKAKAKQAVQPLIDLLQHEEPEVVAAAASALAGLADANELAGVWLDVRAGVVDARQALPLLLRMPADWLPPELLSRTGERAFRDPEHEPPRLRGDASVLVPVLANPLLASLAADELEHAGDAAVPALVRGLRHESGTVRASCAAILSRIGYRPVGAEPRAVFLAAQGNWEELAKEGPGAVPFMVEAMKNGSARAAVAAQELGRLKDKSAVGALEQALTAPSPSLRQAAAGALEQLDWKPSDLPHKVSLLAALEK
jgi:HEAT repeat protein